MLAQQRQWQHISAAEEITTTADTTPMEPRRDDSRAPAEHPRQDNLAPRCLSSGLVLRGTQRCSRSVESMTEDWVAAGLATGSARWRWLSVASMSRSPAYRGQLIRGARGPRRRCRVGARASSTHWPRVAPLGHSLGGSTITRKRQRLVGLVAAYADGRRRQRPCRGKSAQPPSRAVSSPGWACGRSVVAAQKPSKLLGRVRFPSPACGATGSGAVW